MAASKMNRDNPQEICDVLNGITADLPGKMSLDYLIRCATDKPLQREQQVRQVSINELDGQNRVRQNTSPKRFCKVF